MNMKIVDKIKQYHFEWKHLLVLFIVLIFFQIIVSYIHKISLQKLLDQTQDWYKQDSAEKLANLSATSLELLLETSRLSDQYIEQDEKDIIQAFNIILSQQLLQQNVEEICILVTYNNKIYAIDNGHALYSYFYKNYDQITPPDIDHGRAVDLYGGIQSDMIKNEQILSMNESRQNFHVFVPLVPNGEYAGAVYLKITPDFTFISRQIISSYDETALIFSALILFGLIAMFYISSYTVKERDEAQEMYFQEREKFLREQINHQKETLFTKRIYHTHHKAEKVMGFIKEDLRKISVKDIDEIKYRVTKYANFISRVIYDMKWYDPPLQTIRNPMFHTNLNEIIEFIINSIFLRISEHVDSIQFNKELDKNLPDVQINEFVVWEILEPLIQNSIDHSEGGKTIIHIITKYSADQKQSNIIIEDNGKGLLPELLEKNEFGVKKLFLENISTKTDSKKSGYGCYLAYEIAKRCGWKLDVENLENKGCRFVITIPNIKN